MRSAFDDLLEGLRPRSSALAESTSEQVTVLDVDEFDDVTQENLDQLAELCGQSSFTFTTIELNATCPCDAYVTHVGVVDAADGSMAMIGYCDSCAKAVGPALQRLKKT